MVQKLRMDAQTQIVIDEHGMNKADEDHKQGKGENPDHHIKHIDDNGFI